MKFNPDDLKRLKEQTQTKKKAVEPENMPQPNFIVAKRVEPEELSSQEAQQKIIERMFVMRFEESRIQAGEEFKELYSDFGQDMLRTQQLDAAYNTPSTQESLGKVAEGLIFSLMSDGTTGEHFDLRATHPYDDYCHGVDVIIEPKQKNIPALGTFDITVNQEDIKAKERKNSELAEHRPSGLEGKLQRSKKYIDYLSRFDAGEARNLYGWLNAGGLHERHTSQNKTLFAKAEQALLVKYYRSSESSEEPNRPGFVIGGPRVIISIDTLFINKALQGNSRMKDMLRAISFIEFVAGIQAEQNYLDKLVADASDKNLLFDTHYAKVSAWSRVLSQPEITKLFDSYMHEYQKDPDFQKQLSYYLSALKKTFGERKDTSSKE